MSEVSIAELHALREELSSAELDQAHLFQGWPTTPSEYTAQHIALLRELHDFAKFYHGGVAQYIRTAKRLLAGAGEEESISELQMPDLLFNAPSLLHDSAELTRLETAGTALLPRSIFVLVAGGLGERLGYSNIKVGLPVETASGRTYLEHYLGWARHVAGPAVPFVIMTSDDTHTRTEALLARLSLDLTNVHLLKQETVFCFSDSAAHLTIDKDGKLPRKPHGHGDVHSLLAAAKDKTNSEGRLLVETWLAQGYEYICFMQDTNVAATMTLPVSLAISEREKLTMNFTCIPRMPKEAVGLLCKVKFHNDSQGNNNASEDSQWVTKNIEYNIFESVAPRLTKEGGDVAAAGSAYSPFPGSINTLLYQLEPYVARLRVTHGTVPEFINPKYTDASRTAFKKPARVESLMQDYAQLLAGEAYRVGGTIFERFTYQPVKNSLAEGAAKVQQGMSAYAPPTEEANFYELMRRRLSAIGLELKYDHDATDICVNNTMAVHLFPIITLDPIATGADTLQDLRKIFPQPGRVHISPRSTLLIEGHVVIESLRLDGVLRVCGPASPTEPPLVVKDEEIHNTPWSVRATTSEDKDEVDQIRGFVLQKTPAHVIGTAASDAKL